MKSKKRKFEAPNERRASLGEYAAIGVETTKFLYTECFRFLEREESAQQWS